jgi:hypothetical protein
VTVQDVSVRAVLAVGLAGAAAYCWVTEIPMTEFQEVLTAGVISYYFAARTLESRPGQEPSAQELRDLLDEARDELGIKP